MMPFSKFPVLQVVAGGAVSIALSIVSVYLLGMMTGDPSVLLAIGALLLSYLVPGGIVVLVLYRAFQIASPTRSGSDPSSRRM